MHSKPPTARVLSKDHAGGSVITADYEVLGLASAFATTFGFLVCYMINVPGRCLRRSRLSVAHPGEVTGDRQTTQMKAPVPLLVSLEEAP